jgi:hypothetical protein
LQAAAARRKEGWGGLVKYEYRRMLALAVMLPLTQQASGINTVIYYSSMVGRRARRRRRGAAPRAALGTPRCLMDAQP